MSYKYYVCIHGSFISPHVNAGWEYVIYDAQYGCIYLTNCGSIPGCKDAEEAELRALLNALLYVNQVELSNILLLSDGNLYVFICCFRLFILAQYFSYFAL